MAGGPRRDEDAPGADEYEAALADKCQRDARLFRLGAALGVALAASWALGAAGASVAWLLLLLGAAGAVWRHSVTSLLEAAAAFEALRVRRRRALAAGESAEWLNVALNRWWVLSADSVFALVKEQLEPLLNDAKPGIVESVELRQFCLGGGSPALRTVRLFDVAPCGRRLPPPLSPPQRTPRTQLALEADVAVDSEDFCMLLRMRLFGKGMGVDLDLAVEKLNISGKISGTLTLSVDVPFPHFSHLSLTFIEKPQVWFSVRILKSVQMMEVPVLKTWLHSLVLEALVSALVDPSSLEFNLSPSNAPPRAPARDGAEAAQAKGVLTVTVLMPSGNQQWEDTAPRWLVLSLGGQRRRLILSSDPCHCSFLVGSLQQDVLLVKIKSKKLINTVTIVNTEVPLVSLNLEHSSVVDHVIQKKGSGKSSFPSLPLRLQYSSLPDINIDKPAPLWPSQMEDTASGVLFVFVHSAEGLVNCDASECNPYCTVFSNRKKVKTTHYLKGTANPQWESLAQFFVSDYMHAALSFVICSWSPRKMADTDLLGLATLSLTQNETWVIKKALPLSGNLAGGQVLVSAVFWPVPSISQQDPCTMDLHGDEDDLLGDGSICKRNSNSWMQQAKMLLTHRDQEGTSDISSLLSHGLGLMEVSIIRAHDLESKDLNGFSDPYCELKVSGEVKYKSTVKKKTLNPCWDESAIMALPRSGETLDVVLWDHDTFGMNDFLGSLSLGLDEIRKASLGDEALFFSLQGVRSGAVELRIRVISEDNESQSCHASSTSSASSPRLPVRRPNEVHVPPPAPPRTVSLTTRITTRQTGGLPAAAAENSTQMTPVECKSPLQQNGSLSVTLPEPTRIPAPVPRLMVTELDASCVDNGGRESVQVTDLRTGLTVDTSDGNVGGPPSPGDETTVFKKCTSDYSSFRVMKQRMKRGLRLRRFKSEASVHSNDDEMKTTAAVVPASMALSVDPSGGGESDATELLGALAHAVSQPDIRRQKTTPVPRRPADLRVPPPLRPDHYSGVEGKVVQAQGLHVARIAQLYCRVRFQGSTTPNTTRGGNSVVGGRTVAKSRLLPAVPNPRFDLPFQLDQPEQVPRHAVILFEVRGTGKEVIGSRRVTLQDLLSAATAGSNEVHTWLALNNGASLEVHIAHGREIKKAGRKIFRSWSVHRIGKV